MCFMLTQYIDLSERGVYGSHNNILPKYIRRGIKTTQIVFAL